MGKRRKPLSAVHSVEVVAPETSPGGSGNSHEDNQPTSLGFRCCGPCAYVQLKAALMCNCP